MQSVRTSMQVILERYGYSFIHSTIREINNRLNSSRFKLIKVDTYNKMRLQWNEPYCYPSEPIFVPSPQLTVIKNRKVCLANQSILIKSFHRVKMTGLFCRRWSGAMVMRTGLDYSYCALEHSENWVAANSKHRDQSPNACMDGTLNGSDRGNYQEITHQLHRHESWHQHHINSFIVRWTRPKRLLFCYSWAHAPKKGHLITNRHRFRFNSDSRFINYL